MVEIDLSKYGITNVKEVIYNPSYDLLFNMELEENLDSYEKGEITNLGAVNIKTGIFTGRSPNDKYIIFDEETKDTVWWTSEEYENDNHPMSKKNLGNCKRHSY